MTNHGLTVIALAVVVFFLLARGRVSVELASLGLLGGLTLLFLFFPLTVDGRPVQATDFFYGFGHEALIAIACLMVHGHALVATGALEPLARLLGRLWTWNSHVALLAVLVLGMALSSVLNDTPVVVLMIPVLVSVALRTGSAPSKTLMPMNFAVLAGGMATTIGTSTNLLVVSIASDLGLPPFGMFDFTPIALMAAVPALLYLWLIAPRLLADRRPPMESTERRTFQAVLHIDQGSYPDGRTLAETLERVGKRMRVDRIQRGSSGDYLVRLPTLKLAAGDRLFVRDTSANIKEYEQALGSKLHNVAVEDSSAAEAGKLEEKEKPASAEENREQLAEIVVTDDSDLAGRTLRDARFYDRYGLAVIAVHRPPTGAILDRDLADVPLASGDVLLVQGAVRQIANLKGDPALLVLDGRLDLPHTRKAPIALAIMFCVVTAAGFGVVPIYIGSLIGVIALLASRTLAVGNVGRALKADVVLLIAASLALGKAVTDTGVAEALGSFIAAHTAGLPPALTLGILMVTMALLTNFVSNNAAAAVGTPLAFYVAQQLRLPPEPFVLAVLFGCNLSFATPMGYQTNILIMATANYRFGDYLKVGLPLVAILATVLSYSLSAKYFGTALW
jgi:di/tricarboxylate transporter